MKNKCDTINVDADSIRRILRHSYSKMPHIANEALDTPITMKELHIAVKQGKKLKAPGYDGIRHDFFQLAWEITKVDLLDVMNQMFIDGSLLDTQKHGIIVCLPKTNRPVHPEEYRPLTLLNADYKLLSRLIANRLRPWMNELLHPSQHCGIRDNNILGAISALRETIANVELTNEPTCLLSLDFKGAFDNIAHSYLFAILASYGFSTCFQERLQRMYDNATSSVQVNGHISSPLPIKCSVRQGCPLSMLLFTICLDPLLRMLDDKLNGTTTRARKKITAVIAYADDVTIILRAPDEIPIVQEALRCYEAASGAKLNIQKSKALALGSWNTSHSVLGIPYHDDLKILGVHMAKTIHQSATKSWSTLTGKIRAQAREAYSRDLSLHQRIRYVNCFILAKAWYTAQILPPPSDCIRQMNTATSWYIWRGDIFRVPLSTLYKRKDQGGWALINVAAKCRALLLYRLQVQGKNCHI